MGKCIQLIAAACAGCVAGAPAVAWEGTLNGRGVSTIDAHVWCFPNLPGQDPTITVHAANPANLDIAQVPTCNPSTQIRSLVSNTQPWRQHTIFGSAGGDTVDWHSMLPFVTPSSTDPQGSLDVVGTITGPHSATFAVTWSGSDPGVAMHLGWFDDNVSPPTLLHQELRVGPWSETINISIVVPGDITLVNFESSGAAIALPPCGSADFNCDGNLGTDADIAAFFACLGGVCPPPPCTSTADFNGDGNIGTDEDIAAFFRVLAGGSC